MDSVAEAHEQRPVEGLLVDDLEALAGRDAALGEESQHVRIGIGHARKDAAGTRLQRLETLRRELLDGELAGRDRVAMWIARGIAELGGDELLELLGEHVLEHLGLGVHAVPWHPEGLDEEQLEQAVMAHHLERDPAAVLGQRDPAVRTVLDQAELAEPLDHPRRRRGRHPESLGEGVGAHRVSRREPPARRSPWRSPRSADEMVSCSLARHDEVMVCLNFPLVKPR